MALTEVVRLRLEGKRFDRLYAEHEQEWIALAEQARELIASQIGRGHTPTVDDIKKVLLPLIELNPHLRNFLLAGRKPLTQQYWITDFADYVLHRVYQPQLRQRRR